MRILTRGPGPHTDVAVDQALVTIGGTQYDTEARQGESEQIIDLRSDDTGAISEGGDGHQVASIRIPPYRTEEVDTGETDEDGNPVIERQRLPINPDQVVITLWTLKR